MALQLSQRLRYPLGVVALVLGIVAVEALLRILLDGAIESGFPAWLPTFGSIGRTFVAYGLLVDAYAYLLVPAAAFWLGVRYARAD